MYPRTFDTLIRVNPDAIIQSYYSDRHYKASVEMGGELEVMAVLEAERSDIPAYVFRLGKIAYGVAPDDIEILQTTK